MVSTFFFLAYMQRTSITKSEFLLTVVHTLASGSCVSAIASSIRQIIFDIQVTRYGDTIYRRH